ncbi:alkaline phosphatase family protein [Haloarcula amylovorans]|uniref:alkaline phosphatase family protein n=1 Tax=Haloarcula amylovorans TaxID=2562280 RepID=UPI001076B9C9|nr:alkaline phosphatase family protein [Halomicroarcula amylolytica]
MVLVVLGIDALDPELVEPARHPNLALDTHHAIATINSVEGEPSTHELWPTIITGLEPAEHGLTLDDDGVAWENPLLNVGSRLADYVLPDSVQSRLGAWILTNTTADAFRTPASYYAERGIETVFDAFDATTIGIPNYVVDPDETDREHQLRQNMGDLFERDPDAKGGHTSADPVEFYEQCLEMVMIRLARARRHLRGGDSELVFAYTSGLDLVGHIAYDNLGLQREAYDELDDFVGEVRADLDDTDELLLVSDHGLQDGVHTHEAMVAATDEDIIERIESVLDVRAAIEGELTGVDHRPDDRAVERTGSDQGDAVREQLEDLGYM